MRKKALTDEDDDTADDATGIRRVLRKPTQLIKQHISFGYESDLEDDITNTNKELEVTGKTSSKVPFEPLPLSSIEEEEEVKTSATSNWTNEEYSDIEDPKWISDQESDEEEAWKEILQPFVSFNCHNPNLTSTQPQFKVNIYQLYFALT